MSVITITGEANGATSSPFDFSKKGTKYRTESGVYTFPSPSLYTYEKNLFYLLKNSVEKLFDKQYIMKPSYLSHDEYGTIVLGDFLMYINGICCLEEFDMEYVVVPKLSAIIAMNNNNFVGYDNYNNIKKVDM